MPHTLSARIQRIAPSATISVTDRARRMRAEGRDIISLSAGEPDFDTPAHIKTAAKDALALGFTKYTAVDGIAELKAAIAHKFQRDNGLSYTTDEIIVSNGAKQSLFNLFHVLLNPGDEVIVPAPYWVSYTDIARLAGGIPVVVSTDPGAGFKITPTQLEAAITPRSRLFSINSPCNPTGAVYTAEELVALGEVLAHYPNITIVSDDIYELIYWGEARYCSFAMACPALRDRTVIVNGMSKAYAMTGWRIGYAAAPVTLVAAMRKLQGQSTGNPGSIAQMAAVAALQGDQACVTNMTTAFAERHAWVHDALNAIDGLYCDRAEGAFYKFINCQQVIERLPEVAEDVALCEYLIENAGIALVPGTAFGQPGFIRMSFATSLDVLREAISRLEAALQPK